MIYTDRKTKVVDAAFRLGKTLIDVLHDVASLAMDLLKQVVKSAFELGKTLVEFVGSMVEFTYRAAALFIEAALDVVMTVVDMLETVVSKGYFVLRKIINGVLQALPRCRSESYALARGTSVLRGTESVDLKRWQRAIIPIGLTT
jgi:phage-related protein